MEENGFIGLFVCWLVGWLVSLCMGRKEGFDAVSKEIRPVSFLRVEFC